MKSKLLTSVLCLLALGGTASLRAEVPGLHAQSSVALKRDQVSNVRPVTPSQEVGLSVNWPQGNGFDYQGERSLEATAGLPDLASYAQAKNPLRTCVSEETYTGNRALPGHTLNPSSPYSRFALQKDAAIWASPKNRELIQQSWNVVGHLGWMVGNEKIDRISGYVNYAQLEVDKAKASVAELTSKAKVFEDQRKAYAEQDLAAYKTGDRNYYLQVTANNRVQTAQLTPWIKYYQGQIGGVALTQCLAEQLLDKAQEAAAMRAYFQRHHQLPSSYDPRFLITTQKAYLADQAGSDYFHRRNGRKSTLGIIVDNAEKLRATSWRTILAE